MKKLSCLIVLLVGFTITCIGQDYKWIGGTGEWDNHHNWSPKGIPGPGDEVLIEKGRCIIEDGVVAEAKNIEVLSGAALHVLNNGQLTCSDGGATVGLINYGLVEIAGELVINNYVGGAGIGIRNYATLTVSSVGVVRITNCERTGVRVESSGTLINQGRIEVRLCVKLVRNFGSWRNIGILDCSDSTGNLGSYDGITNYLSFSNEAGGVIRVDNGSSGIISSDVFNANCIFNNSGKIVVNNMAWGGVSASAEFINHSGGNIHINNCNYGFSVHHRFDNRGYLSCTNSGDYGIHITDSGAMYNSGSVQLTFNRIGILVLGIHTVPVFNNNGEFEAFSNMDRDIDAANGSFINHDDGVAYTYSRIIPEGITNHGLFYVNHNQTIYGVMINHGVVQDLYGVLPNIDNQQVVLRPLQGPLVDGVAFPDATNKVSISNSIVGFGWSDQLSGGNAAALFFSWNNSLFPNAYGAAANVLYMNVKIRSSGVIRKMRVRVINGGRGALAKDDSPDKSADLSTESIESPIVFPNPFNQNINVKYNGDWNWELKDMHGRLLDSGNGFRNSQLPINNDIAKGTYFLSIRSSDGLNHTEKIIKE